METWRHFLTELADRNTIKMHNIGTAEIVADILTKGLGRHKHDGLDNDPDRASTCGVE